MSQASALQLLILGIADFAGSVLTIVTTTLVVGLGYLVYKMGWKTLKNTFFHGDTPINYLRYKGWKNFD